MYKTAEIAYFTMEIAVNEDIPTYSGGLGMLAGDAIRAAADLKVPLVAVSLLYRKGYFFQRVDPREGQREEPVNWIVEDSLTELEPRIHVAIEGREVAVRAWQYLVHGAGGFEIPVLFLDTDLEENSDFDRTLSDVLYGGDSYYRLCQEIVLGMGGVRMLRALGCNGLQRFHMNEGHSSLLTLELLDEHLALRKDGAVMAEDIEAVRKQCVFTTHTPVPAGHDRFPMELATRLLGEHRAFELEEVFVWNGQLNMTYLALSLSHYVNGVAKKHGEISRHMFAEYKVDAITNGVHVATWASDPVMALFDRHIPGWRDDSFNLRYALGIHRSEIQNAHQLAKNQLIDTLNREINAGLDTAVLTLGFARRFATYKRPGLLLHDPKRLRQLSREVGALQIVFAGKAHPQDQPGKEEIKHVLDLRETLRPDVKIVFLENYDMAMGRLLTGGVDVWVNTPLPPMEASGTSGMKAALNGVPSLSVLDGWWIEGCIEGVTGWAVGDGQTESGNEHDDGQDAASLYEKLEHDIIPLYYHDKDRFAEIMRHAMALNGSFFNTQRMMLQYVLKAYFI